MTKKHRYPRPIARFVSLEGGLYGTLDLIAKRYDQLELQMGSDFVQFTREQAGDLREAVQRFLDMEPHDASAHDAMTTETIVAVEEVAEVFARGGKRRGARATE